MHLLPERAWFLLSLTIGRTLRSGKYSQTRIVCRDGSRAVRKHRLFYAPPLVWLADLLVRLLNTGVRILPQQDWERRERQLYEHLHFTSIHVDDGVLLLPHLAGESLATLLESPTLTSGARRRAIEVATLALAELHARGSTHGDAMADNVLVDLDDGVARWIDFENAHDTSVPLVLRRADDVRALLATCLARTERTEIGRTIQWILDAYADDEVTRPLAVHFTSVFRLPLPFHLGQAALSFEHFGEIARALKQRIARGGC